MKSRRPEAFERLAGQSESFLVNWAEKEKKGLKTFKQIWRLKELADRPIEEFPDLAQRFRLFEEWLGSEGLELAASPLTRYQMEEIVAALEKLKQFLPGTSESAETLASSDQLSLLAEKFGARLSGSETRRPIDSAQGLRPVISPQSDHPSTDSAPSDGDLSEDFKKLLRYEVEYMEQYRRVGEHPLSVAGRLLDALSARYHLADEVFAAHLLYFLQAQNFPVGPYLEKFRQIKSRVKK